MKKTTLYLPDELKAAVARSAAREGVSEAEVIRRSIARSVGGERPRPRGGLFRSGSPIAREADAHLAGFGER
ncbi:CopG family transcriptional regulator [Tomitella gaofuii]|uniref:ribbon-helix-helix domain-containing protein n=1 Tax=Tomitella gaofuii TaxID=2760083 RepID=UPI0015FA4F9C|nr:CopG family transcriptional regulator [Tomitella gaofuii]